MTATEWIAQAKGVNPSSETANRILNQLRGDSADNEAVVNLIRCDGVLTAKLLRACNSPFRGLSQRVVSVDQALLHLGHAELLRMVMVISYSAAMAVPIPGYAVAEKEFWRQSLATAATAEVVAASGLVHGDWESVAFTAGLLQDMGELVIGCNLAPDVVWRMRERVDSGAVSRIEAEREELGTDHAEVGACLLESWHLPGDMVEAVANHHQPVLDPEPRLSVVTHLGDGLAHLAGGAPGWGGYAVRVSGDVVRRLGIDEPRLEGLVIVARGAIERMEKFMSGI